MLPPRLIWEWLAEEGSAVRAALLAGIGEDNNAAPTSSLVTSTDIPPSRRGVALYRTSRSHAAPPYDAEDPSRLRCDEGRDADRGEDDDEDSAVRRKEWERREG